LAAAGAAILAAGVKEVSPPERHLSAIGLQLYSVREEMKRDFEGSLQKVADIGYAEIEFAGFFGRSPQQVRDMLDRIGLRAPSAHIGFDDLSKSLSAVLDTGHTIGLEYIVCPATDANLRRTLDDCKRLAETFNKFGAGSRAANIHFAYHNHDVDFAPVGETSLYEVLLAETDPELVKFEMDLYWVVMANRHPLDYFARFPGRFPMVHVKDMDGTSSRGQIELGRGIINFKEIFQHSEQAGIQHYFVEHENLAAPWPSMRANYEYLKNLRF